MKYINLLIWLLICATLLIFSGFAHARPIHRSKLDYVYIENPYLRKIEAARSIRGAIKEINNDGIIKFGIGKRTEAADPFKGEGRRYSDSVGFYRFQDYFVSFSSHYYKNGFVKPGRQLMIIDAPISVKGVNYQGGFAWLGGAFTKAVSYCNGMAVNDRGLPRLRSLEQCIRHEVYHLFCAEHDDSNANIMHPNALASYEEQRLKGNASKLPLNEKARSEIVRCIQTQAKRYRRR